MRRIAPVNLNLLHTFLIVADSESFRRAAERCFRSESAISMQIRQLEDQLGVSLFERTTRHVKLSEEGQHLLTAARKGIDAILAGIKQSQEVAEQRTNQVTVVAAPTVAAALIPQMLAAFRVDFPDTLVTVRQTNTKELTQMVHIGAADFGLCCSILGMKDLEFEPLLDDELLPVFSTEQAQRHPEGITPEEFSKYPLILNEKAVAIRQQLDQALAERGITVAARYLTLEFNTTLALVSSGLGVGVVPGLALLGSGMQVRAVPIIGMRMERQIGIAVVRRKALPPPAMALLRCARRVLSQHQHCMRRGNDVVGGAGDEGDLPARAPDGGTGRAQLQVVRAERRS